MPNDELALKAKIDERVLHKTKNIQMSIELMHKDMEELDKKTALMGKDIDYIKKDSGEIKALIKGMAGKYATKEDHEANKVFIKTVENSNNKVWKIIWAIIGFVALSIGGIVTSAVVFFIKQMP